MQLPDDTPAGAADDAWRDTRALGLCGLLGALIMVGGDLLMLALPVSGAQALATSFESMAQVPTGRILLGGAAAPVGGALYLAGTAFLWRILDPGRLRLVATLGLAGLALVSACMHALFPLLGLLAHGRDSLDAAGHGGLWVLAEAWVGILGLAGALPGLPGGIALFAAVATGRSRLPRALAWLTPLVTIPAVLVLARLLPAPFGGPVAGAGFNLGMLLFYGAALAAAATAHRRPAA